MTLQTLLILIFLFITPISAKAQFFKVGDLCLCPTCKLQNRKLFTIPSDSMAPNFNARDCVVFNAFDSEKQKHLMHGDVIVFRHPISNVPHLGRVIGLEGDTIQMSGGLIILNGNKLKQRQIDNHEVIKEPNITGAMPRCNNSPVKMGEVCKKEQFVENISAKKSYNVLNIETGISDNTGIYRVQKNHVFALGDNRDNAANSRFPHNFGGWGYIPIKNIGWIYAE